MPVTVDPAPSLAAAHNGAFIFPCIRDGKAPAVKDWENRATNDAGAIKRWAAKGYNLACAAGPSNRIIIDLDRNHGGGVDGVAGFLALAGGILPDTYTVNTPSGGVHLHFSGSAKSGTRVLGAGIDVRSRGAYALMPGSVISGKRYAIANDAPITDAPEWIRRPLADAATKAEPVKLADAVELDTKASIARARDYLRGDDVPLPGSGARNNTAVIVTGRLGDWGVSADTAFDLMCEEWNPRLPEPMDEGELETTVHSAWRSRQNIPGSDAPEANFEILPEPDLADALMTEIDAALAAAIDAKHGVWRVKGLAYQSASSVAQQPIEWLWPGHFAVGKIGGIAGIQGDGKSQITCYIAATISRGGTWPDGEPAPRGKVAILSAEDDAADTVVPRLEAAGADLDSCMIVSPMVELHQGKPRTFNLAEDLKSLEALLDAEPDVKAVLIDPISAYLGAKADAYRNTEMRAMMAPLAEMAARRRIAVIFVTHFNKGGKGSALARVTDSQAFTALARTFWVVIAERDREGKETGRKLFLDVKRNISKLTQGTAYEIEGVTLPSGIDTSWVVWRESTWMRPDEALAESKPKKPSPALKAAVSFLADILANGPAAQTEIAEAAKGADIAEHTLRRARSELGVVSKQRGGAWHWELPDAGTGGWQVAA